MLAHRIARRFSSLVAAAVLCLASVAIAQAPDVGAGPLPDPAFDFICWDLHRYSRGYDDALRDARWLKDLGFTHSFMGRYLTPRTNRLEQDALFIKAFGEVGLLAGVKPTLDQRGSRVAEVTGVPKDELMQRGWIYTRGNGRDGGMNVLHPEIISRYTEFFGESTEFLAQHDPRNVLRLFLMGTEIKWPAPSVEAWEQNRIAVQHVVDAAIADGVMKPGQPYDPGDPDFHLWWDDPYGHGKDYRLRKSVEDRILEIIPNAQFMVDPSYAVKIVHGYGATWSYIGNDPKWIGHGAALIEARTWPAPSAHSTQLIRGAFHDAVLEGNLLSLCLGVDKLYHWGVHFLEPGRSVETVLLQAARSQADKQNLTGKDKRQFIEAYQQDPKNREPVLAKYRRKRGHVEPALRTTGRLLRDRGEMFRDWTPAGPRIAVVSANGMETPAIVLLWAGIPFDVMTRPEHVKQKIDDYSCVLVTPAKLHPIARHALDEYAAAGGKIIAVEEIPNPRKPQETMAPFRGQVVWKPFVRNERMVGAHLRDLRSFNLLARRLDSAELDRVLQEKAASLEALIDRTGFKPYVEARSPKVVVRSYDYQDQRVIFAVNDKRVVPDAADEDGDEDDGDAEGGGGGDAPAQESGRQIASRGVANDIDLLIREPGRNVRVIDIDTGEEIPLVRDREGWRLRTTLQPAWYGLYAVLRDGESWKGPGPLEAAPAVESLAAATRADGGGVELSWEMPFDDWVGCEVQWYRIYRALPGRPAEMIDEMYARPLVGEGGILTTYVDTTANPRNAYTYQVQAVTPLRQSGPMSQPATIRPGSS